MTELLYLSNNYEQSFESTIIEVDSQNGLIILKSTLFHPQGGHQVYDTGYIILEDTRLKLVVCEVKSKNNIVTHHIENKNDLVGLKAGSKVRGLIDWERRYQLMKTHTAQHLFSAIAKREFNVDSIDMSIEEKYCMLKLSEELTISEIVKIQDIVNEYLLSNLEVKRRQDGDIIWVGIEGIDERMCGCTHVNSLKEIAEIFIFAVDGTKVFFTVSTLAIGSKVNQQIETLTTQKMLPKEFANVTGLIDQYYSLSESSKYLASENSKLSLSLLEFELEKQGSLFETTQNKLYRIVSKPELEIKQIRPVINKFFDTNVITVIVLCKNNTVLIFSNNPDIPANHVMDILQMSSHDFNLGKTTLNGGGNKNFAQGGPWNKNVKETYDCINSADNEVTAFCD